MKKSENTKKARFKFLRWEYPSIKKKHMGDPTYFEEEIRKTPDCPEIFRWIINMRFPANQDFGIDDSFEGKIFEVTYCPEFVTPEEMEKFFDDYKIRVERAEPFIVDDQDTYTISDREADEFIDSVNKMFPGL